MTLFFFWDLSAISDIMTGSYNITEIMLIVSSFIFLCFICLQKNKYRLELKRICEEQNSKLIMAAIANEECVRTKISDNLHDVGTVLSTVKLYLGMIQSAHLADKNNLATLKDCKDLIDDTVQTTRTLSAFLQPSAIKDFGLTGTIQHFCNTLDDTTGVQIAFNIEDNIERFAMEQELAVFRIVQELTDNIVKHAHATTVNFSLLSKASNTLHVYIDHDGDGLSHKEFEQKLYDVQGLGLKNIQNRLNILKGNIHFEKNDNLMNTISVQVPITI
jgi:signal transduction histidine kinase